MERKFQLALIHGSAREGRFGDKVMQWALALVSSREEFHPDVIDPRDYEFSTVDATSPRKDAIDLRRRIAQADAFIVVTPEYNHGYPAALKRLIDSAYTEWNAKPVAFVSYGGMSGGIRAVEQLRQVFAELHVVTMRDGVAFPNASDQFDDNGNLHAPERAGRSMNTLLAQLQWWAKALRNARHANPYKELVE